MAATLNYTTSATQADDLYTALVANLNAEGWQLVESFLEGSFNWHVWRNPMSNHGLSKPFLVFIGVAQTGTGAIQFVLTEDYPGQGGNRFVERFVPASPILGSSADAYGQKFHEDTSTNPIYPAPGTPNPNGGGMVKATGDYSVAVWGTASVSSTPSAGEQAILDGPNPSTNPMSAYVKRHSLTADDPTAIEYIIHVNKNAIVIATLGVFNNAISNVYVGAYESTNVFQPMPIAMTPIVVSPRSAGGSGHLTRDWTYDNFPVTRICYPDYENFSLTGMSEYGPKNGAVAPTPQQSEVDRLWRTPIGARIGIKLQNQATPVGVLYGPVLTQNQSPTSITPQMGFGDQMDINGIPHVLTGRWTTPIMVITSGYNYDYTGLWIPLT